MAKKNVTVRVRLTEADNKLLRGIAELQGMTLSDWIRTCIYAASRTNITTVLHKAATWHNFTRDLYREKP